MRALLVALAVVVAGTTGYLVGRSEGREKGRAAPRTDYETARSERRVVTLPADELIQLREYQERSVSLDAEVRALRARLQKLEPTDAPADQPEALPVGSRRPDGTLVGGARWSPMTQNMALGFLDSWVSGFFLEAELTEDQKQRLRAEMEKRIGDAMQITADFINGDVSPDQAYAFLDALAKDGRKTVGGLLDARQIDLYHKFERGVGGFVHTNVVNTELTTLRKELGLDPEQEKKIRPLVEQRYRLVQERLNAPIPNMFFRPVRRELDDDIYARTGTEIRTHLTPEQAAAFDSVEKGANNVFDEYRSLLVPKSK
jgi:hypothetical protein